MRKCRPWRKIKERTRSVEGGIETRGERRKRGGGRVQGERREVVHKKNEL